MAMDLGSILVNVSADTAQLVSGFNRAEAAVNKTTKQMTYAVKGLIGAFVGLNTLDIAKNFTKQLDTITSANNKLKLVTKTTEEFTNAQKELFRVAQLTAAGYRETVTLYSKLSDSMTTMGKSQSDIVRTVETVNKAIALSGSTAQESAAALLQLGQAFGSGKLQGDELKSITENAQGLAKAIAEGMGVAVGELKQLGSEGKITSEILANALAKVAASTDEKYGKMTKTIAQSSQIISNSIQKIIGDFDKMTGVSTRLAGMMQDIGKYLESISGDKLQAIADTTEVIGKVALSAGALAVGVKAYNTAVQIAIAYNALFAGSYGAVNSAIVLATVSQVAFNKAVKLSALGVAITAIYGLSESFIEAKKRSDNLSLSVQQLANNFDALELKARLVDVNKELKVMDENIKGYNASQKLMYQGGYDLAYKEKIQLEKSIALIDKKNEALLKGGSTGKSGPSVSTINDEVKKLISPIDVITEKYGLLFKNLIDAGKGTAENIAKINDAMNEEIGNLDKQGIQKQKDALKEKEKAYKETQEKIKALMKEATDLTISDVDKINAKYLEMYDVIKNSFTTEQLNAFNTAWQESVDKVNGTLDAQKAKLDLVNQALATITSELDTVNNKYLEMYEAIKDNPLFDEAKMSEFFKKWQDEVDKLGEKLDFSSTIELDIIGEDKSIQRIQKSFDDLNKSTKKYEENRTKIAKGSAEEAKNEEMFRKDQMNGYINMAGALSSMFESGSKEAATFQAAQTALALVEATRAILTAGTGDPYTAIPRMAAMAIMAKSLLGNIGIAFGGGSTTTTSDAFSSQTANTGTSTILGDATKASESMLNAMSTLEDFAQPQYATLLSMNDYLESIANNIGGVSNLLIKNSGYALGSGYEGFDTGFSNNLSVSSGIIGTVLNPINSLLSNIPVIGQINDLFGGIINTALGGLFGKTSVSQALTDSGINFADAYLRDAVIQLDGSAYQTISTTTKKKSWFSSSSKTSVSTYFQDLNDEIERQFSLVLGGLYSTVYEAGNALDINANDLSNSLDNFVVSIGKISLKDKTADEIQDLLTNVFSSIGDNLASTAVPALTGFQGVGEGLFETLVRVATGIEEASFYSDRLGISIVKYTDIANKQGVVGFEALAQSIIAADEATYGFNNGVVQIIDNLNLTAEELYSTYLTFNDIRDVLEATNQSASNLSSAMITGAGSISALESGTSSYMENFLSDAEQVNIQMSRLSDEFSIAGYALPKTREDFVNLINSINTSTDEGAKAYGRLISLSDDYSDAISALEDIQSESISSIQTAIDALATTFLNLGDSVASTIATLEGSSTDAIGSTNQIKSFWEKRQEIDALLALNGNLTDAQQTTLSSLVGEVNSLATSIQGEQIGSNQLISDELISNLSGLKDNLDLEGQVLSVTIVGIASNVDLISTIASTSSVPTLSNIVTSYTNTDVLSTEIKDILSIIKDNLATYPKRTFDLLDNVINGNQKIRVQS